MLNPSRKPTDRYMGPLITIDDFRSWEIRQHILQTEMPGRFGYFDSQEVPA